MVLKVNGVILPSPTDVDRSREPIWSKNTGRVASGKMVGDIIAYKETLSIKWGILTKAELEQIKNATKSAFFNVELTDNNGVFKMAAYSGALSESKLKIDGYHNNVSVTFIEQ